MKKQFVTGTTCPSSQGHKEENMKINTPKIRLAAVMAAVGILAVSSGAARVGESTGKKAEETKASRWEKPTDFQKRLQPPRLAMMQADNSGNPLPTDPAFLADRLAIINHVTAYSFLIDEGRWDEWFALFSDDILFETTVPCFGTISVKGMPAFRKFIDVRFRGPGSEKNRVAHRHTMGNVHVTLQTATMAEVRTYLLISNAFPDGRFEVFTSGTYSASLEKRKGKWTITRWYIEVDAPAPKSTIPEIPGITSIPDDRPECK
jgi:3-phenylpropionate/cinnamic acid dioxygenase small subunit